jgi:Domain of unknown function (DUF4397)
VKFRITPWRTVTLLAFLALMLGIPAAASASPAAASTGYISLANLSPTASALDMYVYQSGNSSPQFVERDVTYGMVLPYEFVSPGSYTVQMLTAGAPASSKPVLSTNLTVQAGRAYTVAAINVEGRGKQAQVYDDMLTTPAGKSLVRVIQASIHQDKVTFHCSCAPGPAGNIATDATGGSVSTAPIPPGTWTMTATGPTAKASLPVMLTAGSVHTEIVIDGPNGSLEIENVVNSAGAGQAPSGGIATGFGGTAPHLPGSPLPWVAAIGAGMLLTFVGSLRLRRNERRSSEAPRVPTRM